MVEITDDRTMSVSSVHHGCVLNLFSERYSIDLVSIPSRVSKVIIGMDWLGPKGAMIDYEWQLVGVQTPSGGELAILGERDLHGPYICSATRAKRYLQEGCSGFLDYVADTRVEGTSSLSGLPIIRYFPDVFPEDLPRVPPERKVEFQIDLVPGAASIAKASYFLAPPEMKVLSMQLQELLGKDFIRPSSSLWGAPILIVKKKDGSIFSSPVGSSAGVLKM